MGIVQDGEVARIFQAGLGDHGALSREDRIRFDILMGLLVGSLCASIADQFLLGREGSLALSDQREVLRGFLSAPGGASWWASNRDRYAPARAALIDEALGGTASTLATS
jgi:hypothetical protein